MAAFKKNDRVVLPATGESGVIERVVRKADGPWAEQFYEIRLDGNDLFSVTLHEPALTREAEVL
jgi:RNA polymerase-interacting CarD/CdnL/TRCF family regulator